MIKEKRKSVCVRLLSSILCLYSATYLSWWFKNTKTSLETTDTNPPWGICIVPATTVTVCLRFWISQCICISRNTGMLRSGCPKEVRVLTGSRIHSGGWLRVVLYTVQGNLEPALGECRSLFNGQLLSSADREFTSFSLFCRNCFILHHSFKGRHVCTMILEQELYSFYLIRLHHVTAVLSNHMQPFVIAVSWGRSGATMNICVSIVHCRPDRDWALESKAGVSSGREEVLTLKNILHWGLFCGLAWLI